MSVPETIDGTVYAIGDIHGCAAELRALLGRIPLGERDRLVFLGDYIDRGPDSAGVLDVVRSLGNTTALLGNHEQLMLDAHAGGESSLEWLRWLSNGGDATLESFGGAVPTAVLDWLAARPFSLHAKIGPGTGPGTGPGIAEREFFFVHAGIDPRRALDDQDPDTLLWIRGGFLDDTSERAAMVVHGHTPTVGAIEVKSNRINLDAGCCFGGDLVCGVFAPGERPRYLTASNRPVRLAPYRRRALMLD